MTVAPDTHLIYDGDCGFCRYCLGYARALTGDTVRYQPYQSLPEGYGGLSRRDFAGAIVLFRDGQRSSSGARAAFELRALAGRPLAHSCYRALPSAARLSETLYRWVSRHRGLCYSVARFCIGEPWLPARHDILAALFLRCLALIFLIAFASFWVQAPGLIGQQGILPAAEVLSAARTQMGDSAYWQLPTLMWWASSDAAITAVCVGGAALAGLLASLRFCGPALAGLFLLYLSLVNCGQVFMNYQWDMLLLECAVLGLVLLRWRGLGIFLARWLLFRLMFMSGVVKLLSGDANWWQLQTLQYYFETQPLPTPLAWYLHQLPATVLKSMAAATFFVELFVPFCFFGPRQIRALAAAVTALFQLLIFVSGNYGFFNLLVLSLCLLLLDDAMLPRFFCRRLAAKPLRRAGRIAGVSLAALILVISGSQFFAVVFQRPLPTPLLSLLTVAQPLHLSHNYGLFAAVNTRRFGIEVEGSRDGEHWQAYSLRYQPQEPTRAPPWVAPHQPRLDWQMWVAAQNDFQNQYWLELLLWRLGTGSETVSALFADNPFGEQPPRYLRARLYRYEFSDSETRQRTGQWWQRKLLGNYSREIRFRPRKIL